ncbi:MAG: aminoacetone oxidase family FAD-binding enzyme [Rhizobiales bacterium]|nr:aminoacetone oxidase family FAD-binding enzyme [Hyphomicrobiales bacterium]
MENYDVIVLGAGAAGMMCAIEAGRRGRRVVVLDHAQAIGEKIRISGGGRCNFTNLHCAPDRFISENPRFAVSALSRFTPEDFIARLDAHAIAFHEKTLGQLFCDGSAREVIAMLARDAAAAGVSVRLGTAVGEVAAGAGGYEVTTPVGVFSAPSLVVATGGKSIPKMGATGIGYAIAERFGLRVVAPRPGLVPLTFEGALKNMAAGLAGLSLDAVVTHGATRFREGLLFTHRGLSGPSILQISSFWREGEAIAIDLAPGHDVAATIGEARGAGAGRQKVVTALGALMPRRLAEQIAAEAGAALSNLADLTSRQIVGLGTATNHWRVTPSGSEGWRTAEVTVGGVATSELDQRTMAARARPHGPGFGLYFIGEVVDVTGWLGGYNFQWAWSSGWAAGQVV